MSLQGYINTGLSQSLNGIVSITDGLGTTIQNGSIITGDLTANGTVFNDEIQANAQKITDLSYDSGSLTSTFAHNLTVGEHLVAGDLDITGLLTVTGNLNITDNLNVVGDINGTMHYNSLANITEINSDVQITGDVVYGSSLRSTLGNGNLIVGDTFNAIDISTAAENIAFGEQCGYNVTTGGFNTSVGFGSLSQNITGYQNTAIGNLAGSSVNTGSSNTFIGANTNALDDYSYSTAIGANAQVTGDNQIVLGTSSETVYCPNNLNVASQTYLHNTKIFGTTSLSNGTLEFVDYTGSSQAILYPSNFSNNFKFDTSMANGVGFAYNGSSTFTVDNSGNGLFIGNSTTLGNATISGNLTAKNATFNGLITGISGITISGATNLRNTTTTTLSATTGTFSGLLSGTAGLTISGSTILQNTTTTTLTCSGLITGSNGLTISSGNSNFKNAKINGTSALSNGTLEFVDYLGSSLALVYPSTASNNLKFDSSMGNGVGFAYHGNDTFTVDNSGNATIYGNATISGTLTCAGLTQTPRYDSGFFSMTFGGGYQKTHNLGIALTNVPPIKILFSTVSSPVLGTDKISDITGTDSICISHVNSNLIAILIVNSIQHLTATGPSTYTMAPQSSGYLRILIF